MFLCVFTSSQMESFVGMGSSGGYSATGNPGPQSRDALYDIPSWLEANVPAHDTTPKRWASSSCNSTCTTNKHASGCVVPLSMLQMCNTFCHALLLVLVLPIC